MGVLEGEISVESVHVLKQVQLPLGSLLQLLVLQVLAHLLGQDPVPGLAVKSNDAGTLAISHFYF